MQPIRNGTYILDHIGEEGIIAGFAVQFFFFLCLEIRRNCFRLSSIFQVGIQFDTFLAAK